MAGARRNSLHSNPLDPPHDRHPHNDKDKDSRSSGGFLPDLTKDINLGEDLDFVIGLTATALTADQLLKLHSSIDHKAMHFAKAGFGAAVAATAFTMLAREHEEHKRKERKEERERGRKLRRDGDEKYYHENRDRNDWSRWRDYEREEMEVGLLPASSPGRRGTSMYRNYGYGYAQDRSRSPYPVEAWVPQGRRARSQTRSPWRHRERDPDGRPKRSPSVVRFLEDVWEGFQAGRKD